MRKNLLTILLTGCAVFLTGFVVLSFLSSCRVNRSSASYYPYRTECVNVELDGSQTLKAYGMGRNRIDAAAQAKKNAVHDVIFKGIASGSGECQARPLLLEVNAEEKYRSYFNPFFADRGPVRDWGNYSRFVSLRDEHFIQRIARRSETHNVDQDVYSVIVRVKRDELRDQLIRDGILKQ